MSSPNLKDLSVLSRQSSDTTDPTAASASKPPESKIPMPTYRWSTQVLLPGGILVCFILLLIYVGRDWILPVTQVRTTAAIPSTGGGGGSGVSAGSATFQAAGWIEPDPHPIYVSALTDGVVKDVPVLEGQSVKAGDIVARLVDDDAKIGVARATALFKQSEADVLGMQATLLAAQRDWDNPIERVRAVASAENMLASIKAEQAQLIAQIAVEQARVEELRDELQRNIAVGEAIATGITIQAKLKLNTQLASLELVRAQQPILEARLKQQEAEVLAARENFRLRITETRTLDAGKADLAKDQAELEAAQVQLDEARLRLERMVLRAPVDGAVYRRRATPGTKLMLAENSENSAQVVALYDPKKLQVRVDVPLAEAAGVSVGQKAQITIEVLRDKVFTGFVSRITNEADIQKNTLQVKVHIDAPSEQLKPEMLARVQFMSMDTGQKISETTARSAMSVTFAPENTTQKEGSNVFVWIVDKGRGVAMKKTIVLGTQKREGYVEVTSGLQPGDSIITGDTLSLRDGQRVLMMDMDKKEGGAQHGSH